METTEPYKCGDRVKHETGTDRGLGEVLEDQVGNKVQVIFEDADPHLKTFAVAQTLFIKVTGEESHSASLTGLVKRHLRRGGGKAGAHVGAVLSFDGAVQKFRRIFPRGFQDPKYSG